MTLFRTLAGAALMCVLAGIAAAQETGGAVMAAGAAPRSQGVLYRVSQGGQIAYLFGTVHAGKPAFYPLAARVTQALAGADALVLELDVREQAAFQTALAQYATYPPGDTIGEHVSADSLQRLTEALHARGIPLRSVKRYKPWLLANLLTGLELQHDGYTRKEGVEFALLETAALHHVPVAELESAGYQLSLFNTLDDAASEQFLRESLNELSDGNSLRKARNTFGAWQRADTGALDAVLQDQVDGSSVAATFTRTMLLDRRNPEMVSRIEHYLRTNKVTFFGVGLLHLLGKNGLPALLARDGCLVERLF